MEDLGSVRRRRSISHSLSVKQPFGLGEPLLALGEADEAAIDQFGHGSEVVGVGRFVDLALGPFGDGATERDLRLSDQTRVVLEVLVDEVAEPFIGGTSGGLQIPAPPDI